jgi:hypothetical protein
MAPEQARSSSVAPSADSYSVGVMLYEALSGRLPFDGSTIEILTRKQAEDPLPPNVGKPPTELSTLCMELLRRRPQDRARAAAIVARLTSMFPTRAARSSGAGEMAVLDAAPTKRGRRHADCVRRRRVRSAKSSLVAAHRSRAPAASERAVVGSLLRARVGAVKGIDNVVDALAHEPMRRHPVDAALHLTNDVEALARFPPPPSAIARLSVRARCRPSSRARETRGRAIC